MSKPTKGKSSTRSVNPKRPDGEALLCKSCGSYRHMMSACPDSWETLAKVNVAESEIKEE
jgi:hypothetical protein